MPGAKIDPCQFILHFCFVIKICKIIIVEFNHNNLFISDIYINNNIFILKKYIFII